ncbi:MAG: hypothetical protein QXO40_03895 [Candidatus Aenigmatarchaeota archaeon]
MKEYFTLRQLIEATGEEYFFTDVRARYYTIFIKRKTFDFMTVETKCFFSDFSVDIDKKYELSEKGIKELESDLLKIVKEREDELKESLEIYEDMYDIRIIYVEADKCYLSEKMMQYLYDLMRTNEYKEREEEF